jgi:hypothetical protein
VAQQRRHFLRGRWVDPTDSEDMGYFNSLQRQLTPQQAVDAEKVLVDFSRWKPGPAGRGGERVCRKRDSISEGMSDEDEASEAEEMPSNKRRMVTNQPGHVQKRVSAGSSAGGANKAARRVDEEEGAAGPGLLEMLCMVASSVEHVSPSRLESPSTSEDSDKSTEEEAAESTVDTMEASNARPHLQLPVALTDAISARLVTGKLEVSAHREISAAAAAPAVEAQTGGQKEAEHVDEVSVTSGASQDDSSPAVVASMRRSAADEDDAQQHGRPAQSADVRGSWESASTHDSDVSLSPSGSSESRQGSSAAHDVDVDVDVDDATAGGEAGAAVAMTCAERMAASQHQASQHQAAGATARSSCARRMAAASASPPRHALQEVPITRAVEPAVPAPFANLFRSGHVVDEGMSRYPIGR